MISLVDALHSGTLNAVQHEAVRQLRAGILALVEQDRAFQDVKVLPAGD